MRLCRAPGEDRERGREGETRHPYRKRRASIREGKEQRACCVQTWTSGVNLLVHLVLQQENSRAENREHGQISAISPFST